MKGKVFGIGWAKTGTTTLGRCFEALGYSHRGQDFNLIGHVEQALLVARLYDSFEDWPWPLYYKQLDKHFPGSKFILTIRDSDRWIRSYRNMLSRQSPSPMINGIRQKIYGFPFPDVTNEQLIKRYERHNLDVMSYFYGRQTDILAVDWEKGDGWEEICFFLEKQIPGRPFPHVNKGKY